NSTTFASAHPCPSRSDDRTFAGQHLLFESLVGVAHLRTRRYVFDEIASGLRRSNGCDGQRAVGGLPVVGPGYGGPQVASRVRASSYGSRLPVISCGSVEFHPRGGIPVL